MSDAADARRNVFRRQARDLMCATDQRHRKKVALAAVLGNWLEFFDFTLYAKFTPIIAATFFPASHPEMQIILALMAHAVGFLARPLGSVLISIYADRASRKAALTLTFTMMALGTGIIGACPGYHQIGLAAPVLIFTARVLQGFSAGGDVGVAMATLIEVAPRQRRGLYGCWQFASQGLGIMSGTIFAAILVNCLSVEQMHAWGWRVPFFVGLVIAPAGLYLRRTMDESVASSSHTIPSVSVLRTIFSQHRRLFTIAVLTIMAGTVTHHILHSYMLVYKVGVLGVSFATSVTIGLIVGATTMCVTLLGGQLSQYVGLRFMATVPRLLLAIAAYPCFLWMSERPTTGVLIASSAILNVLHCLGNVGFSMLAESFPRSVRASMFSISYALTVAVFGGLAPLVASGLVALTGDKTAVSWYLIVVNLIGFFAFCALRPSRQADA